MQITAAISQVEQLIIKNRQGVCLGKLLNNAKLMKKRHRNYTKG